MRTSTIATSSAAVARTASSPTPATSAASRRGRILDGPAALLVAAATFAVLAGSAGVLAIAALP